jgi:hypothetical protein
MFEKVITKTYLSIVKLVYIRQKHFLFIIEIIVDGLLNDYFGNPILFIICTSTFSELCKNVYIGK